MAEFRIRAGAHQGEKGKIYTQGDVIETDRDLVALFGADKFDLVSGKPKTENVSRQVQTPTVRDTPPTTTLPDFDTMTVAQLEAFAEENEIDLTGAKTKAEKVAILKGQ